VRSGPSVVCVGRRLWAANGKVSAAGGLPKRPLSPDPRKRVDDIKRAMQLEIALAELRGASQPQLILGTSRPNVARIEKELDVRLAP
jgi:hypothetical protein